MKNPPIACYPGSTEITPGLRPLLHPAFKKAKSGVSEFTFAGIYLFRDAHCYRATALSDATVAITGVDKGEAFFMLPFGLPDIGLLELLFEGFSFLKNADEAQAKALSVMGYIVKEDRDNFDYIYSKKELTELSGRRFHKKKNLVNAFLGRYLCEGRPLTPELHGDALKILDLWREETGLEGDYRAAKEAITLSEELQLCGGIYYIDAKPVAYALGEELKEDTFAVHFEKGAQGYKGLMQFVNMSFAHILPDKYAYINREQDLGDEGLRQAKLSYQPSSFVKKYKVCKKGV